MGTHSHVLQVAGIVRWKQHLAAFVVALSVTAALAYGRMDPITVLGSEITGSAIPGQIIDVRRQIQWHRHDCWSYTASTSFIDSLRFDHQVEARVFGLPDYGNISDREWQVPFTMPWGVTKINTRLAFSCAPFFEMWPVVVKLPELEFTVTAPKTH
jgi:hypothetical protein